MFVFCTAAIYFAVGLAKDREQVLEIALVNYLRPALTILFSLLRLRKQAGRWLLPGTAFALTGVCLVIGVTRFQSSNGIRHSPFSDQCNIKIKALSHT